MHTSTLLTLLAATGLALALAQATLPSCVQAGALNAASATGCETASCICTSPDFINDVKAYIAANCDAADQAAAAAYEEAECGTTSSAAPTAMATTMAPSGTATSTIGAMDATITNTWTTSCASTLPTSSSTATFRPYTGTASSSFEYEIAMILAGAAGVAAFLV